MGYSIPSYLLPAVDALGVKWPDINEDDVYDLGNDFLDLASAIDQFGELVADLLADLRHANSSAAFDQLSTHWRGLQQTYLDPGSAAIRQAARACDDGYNAIHIYKAELLAYLDVEIGSILASAGFEALLRLVGHKAIDKAVEGMAEAAEDKLRDELLSTLKDKVKGEIDDLLNKFLSVAVDDAYGRLSSVTPVVGVPALAGTLIIKGESLIEAGRKIDSSYDAIEAAVKKLDTQFAAKSFKAPPKAHSDSRLRQALTWGLEQILPDLEHALLDLCAKLVMHTTGLVQLFGVALDQTDQALSTPSAMSGGGGGW